MGQTFCPIALLFMCRRTSSILIALILIFSALSCKENKASLEPNTNVSLLQKDFITWWNYQSNSIRLAGNFTALDQNSEKISKEEFLQDLITGDYIPIQLKSPDNSYKLFPIKDNAPVSIKQTIKSTAITELKFYKMEGADFPDFHWTDLTGNEYSPKNTQGKILVIKCWFINCYACIKEFPDLNELVNTYKDREDISFISLALDEKAELEEFLKLNNFNYQVVPDQSDFLKNELNIRYYPTHIILDKKGKVLKVVTNFEDLEEAMKYDLESEVKN